MGFCLTLSADLTRSLVAPNLSDLLPQPSIQLTSSESPPGGQLTAQLFSSPENMVTDPLIWLQINHWNPRITMDSPGGAPSSSPPNDSNKARSSELLLAVNKQPTAIAGRSFGSFPTSKVALRVPVASFSSWKLDLGLFLWPLPNSLCNRLNSQLSYKLNEHDVHLCSYIWATEVL